MTFNRLRALLLPLILSVPLGALAGPYTNMFIFGDSLSDTGNLSLATSGTNPGVANGPYDNGRYSDGALWVEGLATGLGLAGAANPYSASGSAAGNNYAYAGARTGLTSSPPGILAQAVGIWGGGDMAPNPNFADPNALYIVVGGGNDMRDARSAVGGTALTRMTAAASAFNNLAATVGYLASKGVKNILVANLPDLGFTPEAVLLGLQAESSDASAAFNSFFGSLMGYGTLLGVNMNLLDMAGISADVRLNPSAYGVTDTTWPCAGFAYSLGTSCAESAFSDVLHPSALVHSLFAQSALAVLGVPEPGSIALFGLAMLALVAVRRRQIS